MTAEPAEPGWPAMKIGVAGGGSWGTALANLLAEKGYMVDFWVFEPEVRESIETRRENALFLPGIPLSENLRPTNDLSKTARDKDLLLLVPPSHIMRDLTLRMAEDLHPDTILVSASKGIENHTHLTMSGILSETLPRIPASRQAVLSGPSFAREVARKVPTVVTVGSPDENTALLVQKAFSTPYFRVYTASDMIGLELGGAVKNVIAIAAGIIDGLELGLNTRAALITRGLAEMRRLGVRMGADPWTFAGASGVGDLVLTCTGDLSRNYTVGRKIGSGMTLDEILAEMRMVAEGVKNARSVFTLSTKLEVEMPICREVHRVLYDGAVPGDAVRRLMTRNLRGELDETAASG
ncbi:MAG: glycerol-3-phosphate dehydrogenase [Desulfobacterales bacterium]|nr:MAG: glycerol-3-phosphate dehydrogenase [Desulfobacterales bacterium]